MTTETGVVYLDVLPDTSQFGAKLQSSVEAVGKQTMQRVGAGLTRTLTPLAGGMALAFKTAFDEWDAGIDAIRAGTGETGKALASLEGSMKKVAGRVTQPLSQVGQIMAELSKRTGQTGKPLEHLATQLLRLEKLGNQATAETVTRVFGDWGIATEKQSKALDLLFRASQETGPSVERLGQMVVQFGAPLRRMGFGLAESAALLGKFEKEGVNTELVMGSMRIALGKMAKEGIKDPAKAFEELVKRIQETKSAGEQTALAMEVFGARAGPDMAAAISEGRFELGDLFQTVVDGEDTVARATKDTTDWADKFAMLRNRVATALGPVGEMGAVVMSVVAGIGPAILGFSQLTTALRGTALASTLASVSMKAIPIIAIGAALVGLGVLIIKNWDAVKEAAEKVWNGVKDAFGAGTAFILNLVQEFLRIWITVAGGIVDAAATAFGWVPGIGDKIQDFRDQFHRTTDGILSDLERQIDRFEGWGEEARGQITMTRKAWETISREIQNPMRPFSPQFAGPPKSGGGLGPTMSLPNIGRRLQLGGYSVSGHSLFPPIGIHTDGSYHYADRAIDVNAGAGESPMEKAVLNALGGALQRSLGNRAKELFFPAFDPVGGHQDHLHLAMDRGGIVRGPALISQGSITEAHMPLHMVGPIFEDAMLGALTRYGRRPRRAPVDEGVVGVLARAIAYEGRRQAHLMGR